MADEPKLTPEPGRFLHVFEAFQSVMTWERAGIIAFLMVVTTVCVVSVIYIIRMP